LEWSDSGVEGSFRFLKRLWAFCARHQTAITLINKKIEGEKGNLTVDWQTADTTESDFRRNVYGILKQVQYDYDRIQFNTVISGCMKLLNSLQEQYPDPTPLPDGLKLNGDDGMLLDKFHPTLSQYLLHESMSLLLRLLSPIAPHLCHDVWRNLAYGTDVTNSTWPKVMASALKTDHVTLVVQINGKLRGKINVPINTDQDGIKAIVLADDQIQKHIAGKDVKRIIVVPKKLVNIVA